MSGASSVLLVLSLTIRQEPSQPDFSGRWVLAAMTGDDVPAIALVVAQTMTRTNVRGEPMAPFYSAVTIQRRFLTTPMTTSDTTYRIGVEGGVVGTVRGARDPPGIRFGVSWRGDSLVIWSETDVERDSVTVSFDRREEVWSIDHGGRLTITVTRRTSDASPRASTALYTRASER
jgi:hypothetical protein